ncbi:facilitated trehalose transporter Tret1-like [Cimex lectularius]|uniref:Major facilitator superfamily (MFS) profile domain-containing protein n=1 Tax=Cimex lectularius TaxID=79782 RepID=A0A8I6RBY8_CIMLE|nr:facilitated trehalose transporter Tret1-like [Cimex lectularius]
MNASDEKGSEDVKPVSKWRRALPQVIASTIKNLLLLDLGMTIAFPTIAIPVLTDGSDPEGIRFTVTDASWFGSVIYICQPIGSVLSGSVLDYLGRKYSLMAVNVPHLVGWLLYYTAKSKLQMFLTAIIMGLGVGFMEAPIITYVGEICEPKLRGTLTAYASLFATFGITLMYGLGTVVDWRTAALIATGLPIFTILALTQVPETPLWLLARGREEDAEKALQWLRGWVEPGAVRPELADLKRYASSATLAYDNPACDEPPQVGEEPNPKFQHGSWLSNIKDVARPAVFKPLFLIIGLFFFSNFTGVTSTRPYMILIIKELQFPIEAFRGTVIFGATGFAGSVFCMVTIAWFKKRPIAFFGMASSALLAFALAAVPPGGWVPVALYTALQFCTSYGATGLVWTLVSEVFPLRGRGTASGLAGASSYIVMFAATKSFQSLKDLMGPQGVFYFFGSCSFIGFLFIYFLMPETEGISLEQIEKNYEKSMLYRKTQKTENTENTAV